MALSLTVSSECRDGAGYGHLTGITGPGTGYTYQLTRTSDGGLQQSGLISQATLPLDFDTLYDDTYTLTLVDANDATNTGSSTFTLSCDFPNPGGGTGGGGGPTDPGPDPVYGCTAQNALNYDPAATQDTTPTACVFVEVVTPPAQLVAAHLPIPVVLRASPTLDGQPAIVVLHLDTATTLAGPWTEYAQTRAVADVTATVAFNLSEAAKSLLRIAPPVESGTDPNLSALLRVRYEVLDPVTLNTKYTGDVGTCRVLNAVVEPVSGALLTTPTPYATVPVGGALWGSIATYSAGVTSTRILRESDGCGARQFVWLNAKGVYDSGFFGGRHQHGTDQQDPIGYRDTAGADRYASRGTVRDTLQVYSDVLDWPTYGAIRGIRSSIQVYERLGPGQYVPVRVNAESFPEYTEQTDKTFQVNFTVSYPAQLIQTQ